MSEPFLAEIRIFGFAFAPRGWAQCNGQIMPINQNQSLYSLIGTIYGGDGRTSFALPNLESRTPIHVGSGHVLGQRSGSETVTLTTAELASHTHYVRASSSGGNSRDPGNHVFGNLSGSNFAYRDYQTSSATNLRTGTIANAGGGQSHDNMQPFITWNFCIAITGLFPSRN